MIRAGVTPSVRALAACRTSTRPLTSTAAWSCTTPLVRRYSSALLRMSQAASVGGRTVARAHLSRRARVAGRVVRARRCSSAASGGGRGSGDGSGVRTDAELMEELTQHVLRARESMATPYGAKGSAKPRARAARAEAATAATGAAEAEAGSAAAAAAPGATRAASETAGESIESESPAVRTLAQQPRFGGALGTRAAAGHKVRGYLAGADGGETPAFTPFILAFAAVMGVSVFLLYVPRSPRWHSPALVMSCRLTRGRCTQVPDVRHDPVLAVRQGA